MNRVIEKKCPGLLDAEPSGFSQWYYSPEQISTRKREEALWDETEVLLKERNDFEKFKSKVVEWTRVVIKACEEYQKTQMKEKV